MFELPDFSSPSALGGGRSWTAAFESVDPRKDEAYWWVTLTEADGTIVEFFVRIYVFGPVQGDADRANLQEQIAKVAAKGSTNTKYIGSMMWRMHRREQGLSMPAP